jgi:hypothetical protein
MENKDTKRFWSKVDKNGPVPLHCPELGPCWVWTGTDRGAGYGTLKVQGKMVMAHRFSYQLKHGPIPSSVNVLHKCDNKRCCRDSHHFTGNHARNVEDKVAKGRQYHPTGSLNAMSKLTEELVKDIRSRREAGKLLKEIAEEFGICQGSVSMICSGKRWK